MDDEDFNDVLYMVRDFVRSRVIPLEEQIEDEGQACSARAFAVRRARE